MLHAPDPERRRRDIPSTTKPPPRNRIRGALPANEYERLPLLLTPVALPHGETLSDVGERIRYVYFLEGAVVSLVTRLNDGAGVEVWMIGGEEVEGPSPPQRGPRLRAARSGWTRATPARGARGTSGKHRAAHVYPRLKECEWRFNVRHQSLYAGLLKLLRTYPL